MRGNNIKQSRPESRFDNYEPQTPEQQRALQFFKSMAGLLKNNAANIARDSHPFPYGAFYVVSGKAGTGKTHLAEALVNDVLKANPECENRLYLFRGDFTTHMYGVTPFKDAAVIILDDLYSELQDISGMSRFGCVQKLIEFLTHVYEERCLVIATSNFPFLKQIVPMIEKEDKMGRATSRIKELFSRSGGTGELELNGPYFRTIIAQRANETSGTGFFPSMDF